jgi:hypothetical protein
MFKDFELFSSQYTDFSDSGKKLSGTCFRCNTQNFKNRQLHTQLSRNRQRFRGCRKNKKCSIFYELFEYQQKLATFSHWTGPLKLSSSSTTFSFCIVEKFFLKISVKISTV